MSESSSQHGDGTDDRIAQRERKKRVRNPTVQDRAKHRDAERDRRDAFNSSLVELSRFLPSLEHLKEGQVSKHVVVEESVKHHRTQQALIERISRDMDELRAERDRLVAELNILRTSSDSDAQDCPRDSMPTSKPGSHRCGGLQHPVAHTDRNHSTRALDTSLESQMSNVDTMKAVSDGNPQSAQDSGISPGHPPISEAPAQSMDFGTSQSYSNDAQGLPRSRDAATTGTIVNDMAPSVKSVSGYSIWGYSII